MTLYLDTSVISALFDQRNPERQEITKEFLAARSTDRHLVSDLTLAEIANTPNVELRKLMREIAERCEAVPVTEEVDRMGARYIAESAIMPAFSADAY